MKNIHLSCLSSSAHKYHTIYYIVYYIYIYSCIVNYVLSTLRFPSVLPFIRVNVVLSASFLLDLGWIVVTPLVLLMLKKL